MKQLNNQNGAVIVWCTLMITMLLIMVGMGLDTGQLTYSRATGQTAVDAAALSAVSAIPTGDINQVRSRATTFTDSNTHLDSKANPIKGAHVTLMEYDFTTGDLKAAASIATANAARVALETSNPYDAGATNSPMKSPLFLTPLLNLFGLSVQNTQNVSVSAVAVTEAIPTLPIVIYNTQCSAPNPIKIRATSDPTETGCWTTFFDKSTSTPEVVALMQASGNCEGAAQGVKKGSIIHLNDGTQKPDYDAADNLFKAFTSRCWIVPVVAAPDPSAKTNNCNQWQEILDFAKLCPVKVVSTGSPKYIEANVTCGQDPKTSRDAVCFSNRLVRDKPSGM